MSTKKTTTKNTEEYHIHFGPKKLSERETIVVDDEDEAINIFHEKEALGMHVDVDHFTIETKVTKTRLTKPEKK